MLITSLTSKHQATIPLEVRKFLDLKGGDKVIYEIDHKSNTVILKKVSSFDIEFHKMQEGALAEDWLSAEDERAFGTW